MCNSLSYCFLESESHLSTALFLCALVHQYVSPSKRFAPEPIAFVNSVLSQILKPVAFWRERQEWESPVGAMSMQLREFLGGVFAKKGEKKPLDIAPASAYVQVMLQLIRKFSLLYAHLDCYHAIFGGMLCSVV